MVRTPKMAMTDMRRTERLRAPGAGDGDALRRTAGGVPGGTGWVAREGGCCGLGPPAGGYGGRVPREGVAGMPCDSSIARHHGSRMQPAGLTTATLGDG